MLREKFLEKILHEVEERHICLNNQDIGTLLISGQSWDEYVKGENSRAYFYFGAELESLSYKDSTIESGANVFNNNVELRINYAS